ncbi:MAG: hypothetical protein PHT88_01055 [Candidatus Moranbacteria bacterium]|nr:hypothetical protein [Candidatus Moranbacteria bacterium]
MYLLTTLDKMTIWCQYGVAIKLYNYQKTKKESVMVVDVGLVLVLAVVFFLVFKVFKNNGAQSEDNSNMGVEYALNKTTEESFEYRRDHPAKI